MKTTIKITIVLAMLGFAVAAQAQLPAPFAGGVLLQQGGASNQGNGLMMKSLAGGFAGGNYTLTWTAPPASNGIMHFVSTGAGTGSVTYGSLDLTQDVGSSILPIANGGTNSGTALSGTSIMIASGGKIIQGNTGTATQVLHGDLTYGAVGLTTDVSGVLPVANGGTNNNTLGAAGTVAYSDGSKITYTAAGTKVGQVLSSNIAGAPSWIDLSSIGIQNVVGTAPINVNVASGVATVSLANDATLAVTAGKLGIALNNSNTWLADQILNVSAPQAASLVASLNASTAAKTLNADVINYDATLQVTGHALGLNLNNSNTWLKDQLLPADAAQGNNLVTAINAGTGVIAIANGGTNSGTALTGNQVMVSSGGKIVEGGAMTDGQIMIGATGGAPKAANITAGSGISIVNAGNSITISANSNNFNKMIIPLTAGNYNYTANVPTVNLSATTVITITVLEKGGYPITATVTNITPGTPGTFDFVLSGYPTAGSSALVAFQN